MEEILGALGTVIVTIVTGGKGGATELRSELEGHAPQLWVEEGRFIWSLGPGHRTEVSEEMALALYEQIVEFVAKNPGLLMRARAAKESHAAMVEASV